MLTSRHAAVELEQNGVHHEVDFGLPMDLDVEQGRRLVRQAFEQGPTLQVADECFSPPASMDPQIAKRTIGGFHQAFTLTSEPTWALLERQADQSVTVTVDTFVIYFLPPADGGDWRLKCWSEWVVVT